MSSVQSDSRGGSFNSIAGNMFGATGKRKSRQRQSTLNNREGEIDIVDVQYLDGKKEHTSRLTREGHVLAEYSNGDTYKGHVAKMRKVNTFVKSGKGTYTWKSGAVYEGWYKNNNKHGRGKYTTKSGVKFEGMFVDGYKEGQGRYEYTDGSTFTGTWKKGKRSGKGKYVYKDGSTQTGEYENGKLLEHTKKVTQALKQIDGPQLLLLAPPGAGQEETGRKLSEELGVVHLMIESVVQTAAQEDDELGKKAKAYLDASTEVPDEVMTGLVSNRLDQDDVKSKGFILDGFPTTVSQVRALASAGVIIGKAIILEVGDETLRNRMASVPPGTSEAQNFEANLARYKEAVPLLVDYFHEKACKVSGEGSADETWELVKPVVEA